jgi:hypothetical protein
VYVDDVSILAGDVSPRPTRTPVPTATATATPVPTAAPTATQTVAPCEERIQNGGFDGDGGWVIPETPVKARFTAAVARSAPRSLQVGITPDLTHEYSYSSAEQRLSIPAGYKATLRLWHNIPAAGGSGDYGYLLFQTGDGTWRYLDTLREPTAGWEPIEYDLSAYAGQTILLRVGMRNDGRSEPMVMYVDDVSLQACRP